MKHKFRECYIVSFDYQKPDGYWRCSEKEDVIIECVHGVNEKNNHQKAEDIIRLKYPNCKINSVTYV